ncbi:MAG: patatin-like phospholipase family protein [Burkholderiaceae bacterium]|uniref:patatin-like phospholipase family protein n=1 Tax=Herbaspirillum sp. RV1423 TaxID=1443993 RepID=UPI0004B162D4|nr:patatin-like phospholipase family protein [Herbaspirillum sp. RV1423]MDO8777092.1 patatin-like phospholipase family protein [Burkholderiaceae bacterium]
MNEPQTNQAPAAGLTPPARPRIGLALGSGSARGLAHIGVLRALKEAGITVDLVAGTSMGAVIGAVFASGKIDGLSARLRNLDWPGIVALLDPVFPRSGLIDGQRVAEFVRAHVPSARIEDLLLPFAAVATDITNGEQVVATRGDLTEAVRASIAVPGIVTPVRSNGRILVDGGLVNPVPVSVARAMGADLVIAVDLNHDIVAGRLSHPVAHSNGHAPIMARLLESLQAISSPVLAQFEAWLHKAPLEPLPGIFDVLLASLYIMQARVTDATLQQDQPEVLIQPPLGAVRFMEFDRAEEIIDIGYRSAAEQLAHWTRTKTHE